MAKRRILKPKPPADLTGEALCEWNRVTDELLKLNLLETTDRALLTLYCRTWEVWSLAYQQVRSAGFQSTYSNGISGEATSYKVMNQQAKQIASQLQLMGLTIGERKKRESKQKPDSGDLKLEF
jgi:P27 family predicted phage terminase small subunit